MFSTIMHSDWSIAAGKRWTATAHRHEGRWRVDAATVSPNAADLIDHAFRHSSAGSVLLGFDFPIGLPVAYGLQTGLGCFKEMLVELGHGVWDQFFDVAINPGDVSLRRPFYPQVSLKGVSRSTLVTGLGVRTFDDLLRVCDRRTANRQAACSIFWTLGGNQVGKATASGWRQVVQPAFARGAGLWPFDGTLAELAKSRHVVVAETYPAEAYGILGVGFRSGESKRRRTDRQAKADRLLAWSDRNGVDLSPQAQASIVDGFGSAANGEDQFDSILGLFKMIEVVEQRWPETTDGPSDATKWEGWILGR